MLSGIATALGHVLAAESQNTIASLCGVTQPAICRRQDDLHMWPASDLFRLAQHRSELREAIVRSLSNHPDCGDAAMAIPDLLKEIEASGSITNEIAKAISDGNLSRREAAEIRQAIQHRRNLEDDFVLRTLAAIEGAHL
jgi:hypothetical protein